VMEGICVVMRFAMKFAIGPIRVSDGVYGPGISGISCVRYQFSKSRINVRNRE